jgi:Fungalysin metallopeptidase (M36)/Fungalysin/Thermolysin Propeptide Motif/F5/8 type C domain
MKPRRMLRASLFSLVISTVLLSSLFAGSAQTDESADSGGTTEQAATGARQSTPANLPKEIDVRGPHGVPKGLRFKPNQVQLGSINALKTAIRSNLQIQYNALTATPRHMYSHGKYLTAPSRAEPETIARSFISRWRSIFRFTQSDIDGLRLKSRAKIPDMGTTVMLFEQTKNGLPVYQGQVLVNVNRAGQIMSVGGESFPQMTVSSVYTLTSMQAIIKAATALGITGFRPVSKGTKKVPSTFGDLPQQYAQGQRFTGGGKFSDEIVVTKVIFPLGAQGRPAYHFTLTTPQYKGIMWNHIVDAQTGAILRRSSLTAFQQGGGPNNSRRSTLRPDLQDMVEGFNPGGTAQGRVFDVMPTVLSGPGGFGRQPRGTPPNYAPEGTTTSPGRGFRRSWVRARNNSPYADPATPLFAEVYNTPFAQVLRGLPDALNPTPQSPFGWFYLPTGNNGAEVATDSPTRATTRAFGYTMHAEAKNRNEDTNSPLGNGDQPYSATVTPLAASVETQDGRNLTSVIESNYTEGNNVLSADDHANDNEGTHGIRGYSATRKFTASYFDFINSYEYGNVDASQGVFPPSTFPDVYPGTTTLFYYTNILHDYFYSIGFTEALWNFQQDNFGKGGLGHDAVSAQVQDGSGIDNANFNSPPDGTTPRMQMFLWTEGGTRRSDGDFDFDIVTHELYHGVSNRSVGKGTADCLGVTLVGESGGMGEGWGDFTACSMTDDDAWSEYETGAFDIGLRHLPLTNFRYSYGAINGSPRRRDQQPPGTGEQIFIPFEVHDVGEMWAATLWDMRELMIVKQNSEAIFFDGERRLGNGTPFYIGTRLVKSFDTQHPINYRASFHTATANAASPGSIVPTAHAVRPNELNNQILLDGHRNGPIATSVRVGARLADTITLRGMQIAPCHPSFVDMRDSMLLADTELTGGENRAIIWRAFASHGVGVLAASTSTGVDPGSQNAPVIVEDFSVPATVTACETSGPLAPPTFALSNPSNNTARVTITAPVAGAATYIISRGDSASGPFIKVAEIPSSQTTYDDAGLPGNRTYFYQVRSSRNADCIGTPNTGSVFVAGEVVTPAPLFSGVERVDDPHDGSRLILSWGAAVSLNQAANIVYDIHRVTHVDHGTGENEPTFTPTASNKIATVTGTSYVDVNLKLAQVYYYIVRARDTTNGKIDTDNTGNTRTRYNAPTIPQVKPNPPFALETFETPAADTRFTPPLTESTTNPDQGSPTFQRIEVADLGLPSVGKMYAPDFSPGHEANECDPDPEGLNCGGQSDFYTQIGPFNGQGNPALTDTSIMEFENFINAEGTFDGGNIEVKVGAPFAPGDATPFPNNGNVTQGDPFATYDLGDYIIEGHYNGKLDGGLPVCPPDPLPCRGSALQGRRAYTGVKGAHRVRAVLHNFAPGGLHNPQGLPVFIRFRMTSDVASAAGLDSGWIIDNLVINNLACRVNIANEETGATASASSSYANGGFPPDGAIDGDRKGADWGNGGGWNDNTRDIWPDWWQVDFNGSKTINEIRVYTVQNDFRNPVEPTLLTPANIYGIKDFDVQYWNGTAWVTVPAGSVTDNDKAMRVFVFPEVTTSKVRITVTEGRNHFSRILEVEAFGCQ